MLDGVDSDDRILFISCHFRHDGTPSYSCLYLTNSCVSLVTGGSQLHQTYALFRTTLFIYIAKYTGQSKNTPIFTCCLCHGLTSLCYHDSYTVTSLLELFAVDVVHGVHGRFGVYLCTKTKRHCSERRTTAGLLYGLA